MIPVVGDRVRITHEWRTRLLVGGVSPGYVDGISCGRVLEVEVTDHWTAVTIETDAGKIHAHSPDDLEPDVQPSTIAAQAVTP